MNFLAKANEIVLPFNFQEQADLREHHMMVALKGLGFSNMNCILTLKNAGQMLFLNIVLVYVFFGRLILAKITNKTADIDKAEKLKK